MYCNYLINSEIGGGKLGLSVSCELAIWRFSMRAKTYGNRCFLCLLMCMGMCACTNPIPADAPENRSAEVNDGTSLVTGIVTDCEWGDSVEIGY